MCISCLSVRVAQRAYSLSFGRAQLTVHAQFTHACFTAAFRLCFHSSIVRKKIIASLFLFFSFSCFLFFFFFPFLLFFFVPGKNDYQPDSFCLASISGIGQHFSSNNSVFLFCTSDDKHCMSGVKTMKTLHYNRHFLAKIVYIRPEHQQRQREDQQLEG